MRHAAELFGRIVRREGGDPRYSHNVREWSGRPDAFIAWLYCGALGWLD